MLVDKSRENAKVFAKTINFTIKNKRTIIKDKLTLDQVQSSFFLRIVENSMLTIANIGLKKSHTLG